MKLARKSLLWALPLIGLFVCSAYVIRYLQSSEFDEFVRAGLISRLEKATGLECRIENLHVDVFHGRYAIDGLELSRRNSLPGLVHLKVPQIRASLSISSLWHFQIRLNELIVVQPNVDLVSGDGESSWSPEDILNNLKISLKLEAAKVKVANGWLRLNKKAAPFSVSLDDLDLKIGYEKKLPGYKVHIRYGQSRIFWEKREIYHSLDLSAHVSLEGIEIDAIQFGRATAGTNTVLTGSGSFRNWKSPVLRLHLAGTLDARDLVLTTPTLYEGKGDIQTALDLRNDRDGIFAKGTFLCKSGSYRKMKFSDLYGAFEIQKDVLHLRDAAGRIADGAFLADAAIQLRNSNKDPNRVNISARKVPVVEVGKLLDLPLLIFENGADSKTVLTWYGGKELRADCNVTLHGIAKPGSNRDQSTPLDGTIQFTYFESGTLVLKSANLLSSHTSFRASEGTGNQFRVQLSTARISEPLDFIANFSGAVVDFLKRNPDTREIGGSFDLNGDARINSSSDIEYRGKVMVKNGRWRSYRIESLSTEALFRPPLLELRPLEIHSGTQMVNGSMELDLGEGDRVSKFGFRGDVRQVSITALRDFGMNTSRISGLLSGRGSVLYARDSWEGEGQFSIENGSYKGESFDSVSVQLSLNNQKLRVLNAEARRNGARLSAEGLLDLESRKINATGRVQGVLLEEIPLFQDSSLRGRVGGKGGISGTLENPAFSFDFDLNSFRYNALNLGAGTGHIEFRDNAISANTRVKSELGDFRVKAEIAARSGYPGKTTMEFDRLDIQKVITEKPPAYLEEISTALEGKLEAEGNFADLSSLRIRGEVDGAHFTVHDHEVHNAGRMRFTILNRNLRIESVRFVGEGSNVFVNGTIPLDNNPSLDLNLNGNLNLELLEGFEKKLRSEGTATLNIRASGTKREPQVIGRASFRDARIDHEALPFRFSSMQGDIVFSRNLIRFENIRGAAASGSVQVSGTVEHQNAVLRALNLAISMRNARLPYPKDFRSVANADLVLNGNADAQMLSGDIEVTRMEYVRSFNLLEQLASRSVVQTGPLTTEPYLLGLRLNIEIRSENGLSIDNELTRLRGGMRLMLRGTPAYPSLTGHVEASEGTIFFRGSRFEISHAAADFIDRNRINPVLEIRAEADVKTYRLILDAVGDLEHLNLNISSDPPMSTVDILSLLTTGKTETGTATATATGTSQRESQMAGMSAASVLSENLTGVIGKRVQRIFGLESFRVDPFLAGAENDPTARITISERISRDLVVTFSRNLTTNQEQIAVIEYDLGKNISVVATRDEDGKFGLDFRFRKRLR